MLTVQCELKTDPGLQEGLLPCERVLGRRFLFVRSSTLVMLLLWMLQEGLELRERVLGRCFLFFRRNISNMLLHWMLTQSLQKLPYLRAP